MAVRRKSKLRQPGDEIQFLFPVVIVLAVILAGYLLLITIGDSAQTPAQNNPNENPTETSLEVVGEGNQPTNQAGRALQGAAPVQQSSEGTSGSIQNNQGSDGNLQPGAGRETFQNVENGEGEVSG